MSYLITHGQINGDPFHLGHTSVEQLGLGYPLTCGLVYPYPAGGVVLLRRPLYPAPGSWSYCGFARPGETTITSIPGFGHAADDAFQYTATPILGNGFIGKLAEPVRIDFDADGDLITPPLPMFPINVTATAIAAGKFFVSWTYDTYGQGGLPTDFQVFRGVDAAGVDYDTPLGTVAYRGRGMRYTFTTGAYADRTDCVFAVRGRNANGVAERNTNTSIVKHAEAATPAAASAIGLTMRRV